MDAPYDELAVQANQDAIAIATDAARSADRLSGSLARMADMDIPADMKPELRMSARALGGIVEGLVAMKAALATTATDTALAKAAALYSIYRQKYTSTPYDAGYGRTRHDRRYTDEWVLVAHGVPAPKLFQVFTESEKKYGYQRVTYREDGEPAPHGLMEVHRPKPTRGWR